MTFKEELQNIKMKWTSWTFKKKGWIFKLNTSLKSLHFLKKITGHLKKVSRESVLLAIEYKMGWNGVGGDQNKRGLFRNSYVENLKDMWLYNFQIFPFESTATYFILKIAEKIKERNIRHFSM